MKIQKLKAFSLSLLLHASAFILVSFFAAQRQSVLDDTTVFDLNYIPQQTTPSQGLKSENIPKNRTLTQPQLKSLGTKPSASETKSTAMIADESASGEGSENIFSSEAVTELPKIVFKPKDHHRTDEARKNGYTGKAHLKIIIDSQGVVKEAKMINDLKFGLNERALEIVKQIKFSPARIQGKPVAISTDFFINFNSID